MRITYPIMTQTEDIKSSFDRYLNVLSDALSHKDRHRPLKDYIAGLCLSGTRKSIEPMAARIDPYHVQAKHQSMHHFVARSPWDDEIVLRLAREVVVEQMSQHGEIAAWIVDDTGIPKKGRHSVGVARQYCGVLGKTENCQVAVSISVANEVLSIPVAYRLYLPESWANDNERRSHVGVPETVSFQKKWQIALDQIGWLSNEDVPKTPVIADAGYGNITTFRETLTGREIPYVVGIHNDTTVWPPNMDPLEPLEYSGRGRSPARLRRDKDHHPVDVMTLAKSLPGISWLHFTWREGTNGDMQSRFAVVRVRPAHNDVNQHTLRSEEWLLIEWPKTESAPTKFWLSTLSETIPIEHLVKLAKMRWRIERDYQELKSEFGLGHYEGRGWRGFHHHGTLCITAYAFMVAERARQPPPELNSFLETPPVPKGFKPRGSPCSS